MRQLGEVGWEPLGTRQVVVWFWKVTDWFRSFGTNKQCDLGTYHLSEPDSLSVEQR